ncbi:hypothetical protein B0A55_00914 [Friedmanniomyces simplex]|uniref:Mso1 N-terminal domain-containing protein n=1 Tax=Friedmanniomyces simplex TaxID=329884 RepID=A0A4U0XYH2_9PEZI|nr:hypothetical protein B0A55_00914 [Friedmanniomyces simplex]
MSSYLSNLLTSTTSRYNTLRRTLLPTEDDGDTEDDSHLSRVLRAYYTEKARPYPPWLPPDPNDRRAAAGLTPQPYGQPGGSSSGGYFASAGGRSRQYLAAQNAGGAGGQRGSLSDLWDAPAAHPPSPLQPQSLRAGRRVQQQPTSSLAPPTTAQAQARPLPSQRAGSYQTVQAQSHSHSLSNSYSQQQQRPGPGQGQGSEQSPPSSSGGGGGGGGGTAQDRLKARLWGGNRSGSFVGSVGGGGSSPGLSAVGAGNPYEQATGVSASANAPWSSHGNGGAYDTGGGGGGGGASNRRYGRAG